MLHIHPQTVIRSLTQNLLNPPGLPALRRFRIGVRNNGAWFSGVRLTILHGAT